MERKIDEFLFLLYGNENRRENMKKIICKYILLLFEYLFRFCIVFGDLDYSSIIQAAFMHVTHSLPCDYCPQSPTSSTPKFNLDTFAFRDRVTNHTVQYRQFRDMSQPSKEDIFERTANQPDANQAKNSLDAYKFTKNFEIACLRSKYLRHAKSPIAPKAKMQRTHSQQLAKTSLISKQTLFQINKQQMKRILQTNDHLNIDILQLNKTRKMPITISNDRHLKKSSSKWHFHDTTIKQPQNNMPSEVEKKITEKIVNHMKNEMRNNCEYLINMPIEKKKKAMFNTQLKKHTQSKKMPFPKYSHSELGICQLAKLQINENSFTNLPIKKKGTIPQPILILLVKQGFMSEILLQLRNNPSLSSSKDEFKNNIFHISAKDGNKEMMAALLKALPSRTCLNLLAQRNHLKRTPKEKAVMHGNLEIVAMLDEFMKENKYLM